jgi:hypothetical protein
MAKSLIAIDRGLEYQALLFWLKASRLFATHSPVGQVGYEHPTVRAFDDVVVLYSRPILDEWGDPISADFYQSKFHVDYQNAFTCQNLIDPAFISAETVSLLQRIHNAQPHTTNGTGARFIVTSPWPIDHEDFLGTLISTDYGQFRLEKLFAPSTRITESRTVRDSWRKHLGLASDDELRSVLRPFRIWGGAVPLNVLRQWANAQMGQVGFRPIEDDSRVHQYASLIRQLHAEGKTLFTRDELQSAAEHEGLWIGASAATDDSISLGIRSFVRHAEQMEDWTARMLCLAKYFDNRAIRDQSFWRERILPEVTTFLRDGTAPGQAYHLYLDTHNSVAFAAGFVLDSRSGIQVYPMQTTLAGREVWKPDFHGSSRPDDLWEISNLEAESSSAGNAVALAISVSNDITEDVRLFVGEHLGEVGRILVCKVRPAPGRTAVTSATHGFELAQALVATIRSRTAEERLTRLHVFASAPNALVFWLGQQARGFGDVVLYEFDFERNTPGGYVPAIELSTASSSAVPPTEIDA